MTKEEFFKLLEHEDLKISNGMDINKDLFDTWFPEVPTGYCKILGGRYRQGKGERKCQYVKNTSVKYIYSDGNLPITHVKVSFYFHEEKIFDTGTYYVCPINNVIETLNKYKKMRKFE